MKTKIEKQLIEKIYHSLDLNKPLLLAYSGGPDSKYLLYLLLKLKEKFKVDLHIAHVDHGQREESSLEAKAIEKEILGFGLKFHLMHVTDSVNGNLEDFFRQKRYLFFNQLNKRFNYSAIMLAHHQNDLEETTLKRFLEGAHLDRLCGLKEKAHYDGVAFFRPLLEIKKSEILKALDDEKINYFTDHTNFDTQFLRARFRKEILPKLEDGFGKNIRSSFVKASKYSEKLSEYLEEQVRNKYSVNRAPIGLHLNLKADLHPFELDYLLRTVLKEQKLCLSANDLEKIVSWIIKRDANKQIILKNSSLFCDRGHFFVLKRSLDSSWQGLIKVKEGTFQLGPWTVKIEMAEKKELFELGWEAFFKNDGRCFFQITNEISSLGFQTDKKLREKLSKNKAPNFLKEYFPNLKKEDTYFELVTDQSITSLEKPYFNVTMTFKKH